MSGRNDLHRMGTNRWLVVMLACIVFGAGRADAQVAAAAIAGIDTDQAGTAVPGATITVTETATNRPRVVASSAEASTRCRR